MSTLTELFGQTNSVLNSAKIGTEDKNRIEQNWKSQLEQQGLEDDSAFEQEHDSVKRNSTENNRGEFESGVQTTQGELLLNKVQASLQTHVMGLAVNGYEKAMSASVQESNRSQLKASAETVNGTSSTSRTDALKGGVNSTSESKGREVLKTLPLVEELKRLNVTVTSYDDETGTLWIRDYVQPGRWSLPEMKEQLRQWAEKAGINVSRIMLNGSEL